MSSLLLREIFKGKNSGVRSQKSESRRQKAEAQKAVGSRQVPRAEGAREGSQGQARSAPPLDHIHFWIRALKGR
jgi:hypothetical protein